MHHFRILPALLFSYGILAFTPLHGQTPEKVKVKVRISSDKEAVDRMMPQSIMQSTPGTVLYLRDGSASVRAFQSLAVKLDLYDLNKLTYIRSQNPPDKMNGETLFIEDMVHFAGGPLLVATTRRSKEGIVEVHTSRVDPLLTKAPAPFEMVCRFSDLKVKGNKAVVSAGEAVRSYFKVRISPDSSHMVVVSPELRDEESGTAIYMVAVIDRELRTVWQRSVDVGANVKKSELMDIELDNNGNVYALVKNNMGNRDVKKGEILFEVKLFRLNRDEVVENKFGLGGMEYVKSAMLKHTRDGRIICVGIYGSTETKDWKTVGMFGASVQAGNDRLTNVKTYSFLEDAEQGKEAVNMEVVDVLPRSDGGYYLVSQYFNQYYVRDAQSGREYPKYAYGSVIVMSISESGEQEWKTQFKRMVISGVPYVGNIFPAVYDDQLFVFLVDADEMAARRKAGEKVGSNHLKDPYSAYVSFDRKTGATKVKPVLKGEKDNDFISGWELFNLGQDRYLALGTEKLTGGRFLPVRIEFSKE